ncbi:universal stress protein YxiE-like isoform X1 [Triticum urartu]|uniref:universal stress protein YxiE-like isoform X1 n=1 Tax=Triticum dicoccoides TaxID=85692 RepID=UPI00188E997F|nr:universal stress protein YxiE-like isoform X1 [Triticum dicoccoides]XP_048531810.1 universal stress protein YxiE-like isoform X1 [Triticum urartu]
MWSIQAAIARHQAGLTASELVVMEESTGQAAAAASDVAPGAGGAEAAGGMKVVVAVDASEESLHALSWALDNVVRLHPGASVAVVHAQHSVDHFVYPVAAHAGLAYAPPTALDSMRRAQEENSRRAVARALDVCRQKQASATAAVVEGDPKEAICEAVEEMRADLLVLGSRGLGMVKRALLGSVSDYLAHHACCPVLIVKPPNKAHHK